MELFVSIVGKINDIVWSNALVFLCLGAGVYFSVRMRFPQVRLFKEMISLIVKKSNSDQGITPFQAFAATVGSRVGMGNIAGVATAIFFGGPGAVFWMWLIAFIGSGSAFAESALAQAYKNKTGKEYLGGPALFIEKGLKCKPWAYAFAISTILGPGILMPGLQVHSIASTFQAAFGVNEIIIGIICVVMIAFVIWGGIKRIGHTAELLAPVMCVIYVIMAIVIIGMNITKIPGVFALIFKSAFGAEQMFAGIMGGTIAWGVKRGIYSNEAGQGSGAIVSAAADCSHPAKQGLIQAFSVYIDTLVVCSASAMIILLTNTYNVSAGDGTMIVEHVPGLQYGILWAQNAINSAYGGSWGGKVLAIVIVLFVFTSLMGYYYQAESNMRYIFKERKIGTYLMRGIFLLAVFSGVIVDGEIIWSMGDLGVGFMAWFNIVAILFLSNLAVKILKDYEQQKKEGKDPVFDPKKFGIDDATGVWDRKGTGSK